MAELCEPGNRSVIAIRRRNPVAKIAKRWTRGNRSNFRRRCGQFLPLPLPLRPGRAAVCDGN